MKKKDILILIKREYLRGFINGGAKRNKNYTVTSLEKEYKKYLKDNPSVISTQM